MAGTLTISTLSDGTNSTSATNCIQGSAKAWVSFTAGGSISGSYNVSSITVNTANVNYTVNFTNAMPSASYATITGSQNWRSQGPSIGGVTYGTTPTTSAVQVTFTAYNETAQTQQNLYVAIFR